MKEPEATSTTPATFTIDRAADPLRVKREVIQRAVNLGAIVLDADGNISEAELDSFINRGFKNHRYDTDGKKLPGVKS